MEIHGIEVSVQHKYLTDPEVVGFPFLYKVSIVTVDKEHPDQVMSYEYHGITNGMFGELFGGNDVLYVLDKIKWIEQINKVLNMEGPFPTFVIEGTLFKLHSVSCQSLQSKTEDFKSYFKEIHILHGEDDANNS